MTRDEFHIAIVGAGLVGSAAALELARLGFAVTLFERAVPSVSRGSLGIDVRNVALSPASQQQLAEIGVWDELKVAGYSRMVVWEEWGVSEITFSADEVGRDELGWLVEMSPLQQALWARLDAVGVVTQVCSIDEVQVADAGVNIRALADGQAAEFTADFVIGADGANSLVRRALAVPVYSHPTEQAALATVVRTQLGHADTAWQRFLHDGPLAFLPSPTSNICSVVWSQSPSEAARRSELQDADFCAEITRAFEGRLGSVEAADRRVVFPLSQQRVRSCAPHPRALLIGDAMRVIHPLAGLGVNLGLEDVRGLVSIARQHDCLADTGIWRRFARARQARCEMMIRIMASLQGVYASSSPLLGWLRNIGVQAVDQQGWIKRQIMQEALGLGPMAVNE